VDKDLGRALGGVVQSVGCVLLVLLVWSFLLETASKRAPSLTAVALVLVVGGGLLRLSGGIRP
jgi:hypothetical protein